MSVESHLEAVNRCCFHKWPHTLWTYCDDDDSDKDDCDLDFTIKIHYIVKKFTALRF